jgi:hypothetical protein
LARGDFSKGPPGPGVALYEPVGLEGPQGRVGPRGSARSGAGFGFVEIQGWAGPGGKVYLYNKIISWPIRR